MNIESLEKLAKPFKLCFKNEIHRISKLPTDYKTLLQNINLAFKGDLPPKWALQYEDADGDRIMLTSDEDYHSMLECEAENSSKSIKIFLISIEDRNTQDKLNLCDISKSESVIVSQSQERQPTATQVDEPVSMEREEVNETQGEEKETMIQEEEPQKETQRMEDPEVSEIPVQNETQQNLTPVILSNNIGNSSAYIDIALDYPSQVPVQVSTTMLEEQPKEQAPEKKKKVCKVYKEARKGGKSMLERRKERFRPVITDVLYENVPVLAELIKDYLKDPSSFNLEEIKKKTKPEEPIQQEAPSSNVIHHRVICDGCGVNPIVGVRYKCAICQDFDYCEKCEAKIEHPHPFLKIKDPKHHPRAIITVLEEDLPEQNQPKLEEFTKSFMGESLGRIISGISNISVQTKEQMSKALEGINQKIFPSAPKESESTIEEIPQSKPVVEEEKEAPVIEKPVEEPVEKKEVPQIDMAFTREICTIPSKITTNDKTIYKTVSLRNTGKTEWPKTCIVKNVGGIQGQDVKTVPLAPGKEFSCILILENPSQAGDFSSLWRLAFYDEKGNLQYAGEAFEVTITVVGAEMPKSIIMVSEPKVEKIEKKEVEKKEEKKYPQKVYDTAKQVMEILPDIDMNELLQVISSSPEMTVEALIEQYLMA